MPEITGTVQDVLGRKMSSKDIELRFILNAPNVGAASPRIGFVYPTEPGVVIPDTDGTFTVLLADTTIMLGDAWYSLEIEWQGGAGSLIDFPGMQIRVPPAGGTISDLITFQNPSSRNPMTLWAGLTPPPDRSFVWNYLDPKNPDRESGPISELTLGDIVTRWW